MSSLRPPRPNYQNTNGFVDPVLKDSEEILNAPVPPGVKLTDVQKARRERKIRDAVEVHRAVEDVLEIKGSYFPGIDAMREAVERPVSSESLTMRIKELETRHKEEIEKMHDTQMKDYLLRVMDAYHSTDGTIYLPEVEKFLEQQTSLGMPAMSAMASEYHSYRYAHLRTLTVLIKQRDELARKEEEERKTRDAQFPQSIAQFIALPNDIQVRVARFLTSADAGKEQMLSAFGWAWRQVRPLMGDFAQNTKFQAQVKQLVSGVEVRDPRRKPS